jgi:hypothetical protein
VRRETDQLRPLLFPIGHSSRGPSGIVIKQKRRDPLGPNTYCDADDSIKKPQHWLQPGMPGVHGRNHHHNRGGYGRRDNVFTPAQFHHDQGADTEQGGHADRLKRKDPKVELAQCEADAGGQETLNSR